MPLLVLVYTQAWQLTGSARYRQVVEETVGYLLAPPIRLPEGAWASAEDADSEGEEGRFYTWSLAEIEEVGGRAAAQWYGASAAGNWEGHQYPVAATAWPTSPGPPRSNRPAGNCSSDARHGRARASTGKC